MGRKREGSSRRRRREARPGAHVAARAEPADATRPAPADEARPTPAGLELALVLLPAMLVALHPLSSYDLPLHLGIGEWILEHGEIPSTDPFSFTAQGAPWVPHEWLVGVLFALVERAAGAGGLNLLLVLGAAFLAWVLRGMTRALGVSLSAHLVWSIPIWVMLGRRIILRPHLFALALPFLVWWLLLRGRARPRLLWAIPLTMVIWVNIHGSFLLGLGVIGLDLIVLGRAHSAPWRARFAVVALAGASILTQVHIYFQPDLLAGVKHALGIVGDPVFHEYVQEWRSPFGDDAFVPTYAFQVSLAWIALAAWGLRRRYASLPLSYLVFVGITMVLYVRHQRFLALFAPASLALMPFPSGAALTSAWRRAARLATVGAALFFAFPGYPVAGTEFRAAGVGWAAHLPVEVLERGLAQYPDSLLPRQKGIFCEYSFGGVLIWRGQGDLQPTMDGRNSVYGSDLYVAHRAALDHPSPFREELLERCGGVLIRHPSVSPLRKNLIDRLARDPRWDWKLTRPESEEPFLFFLKHERRR